MSGQAAAFLTAASLPGLDREAADAVARLILGDGGVSEAAVNKPLASWRSGGAGRMDERVLAAQVGCRRG